MTEQSPRTSLEALLQTASQRVERLGGRLERDGEHLRLFGVGPDIGLDYTWIREVSEEPLVLPIDAVREACAGPPDTWQPALDRLFDERIRFHREQVRQSVAAMLQTWPTVSLTLEDVAGVTLGEPAPLEASRARHEAAAPTRLIAFLQLREMPDLIAARDEKLPALGLSAQALTVFRHAYMHAAAPAHDLRALAARRIVIILSALEALEGAPDDQDGLVDAIRRWLLPLAHMVEPSMLDDLLG